MVVYINLISVVQRCFVGRDAPGAPRSSRPTRVVQLSTPGCLAVWTDVVYCAIL